MDSPLKKILVIDNSQLAADMLARLLKALGYEAASVYSAEQARTYLEDTDTDLVLLDIGMPEMDGYQFVASLRNEMKLTLPVIALTGYSLEEDRQKMLNAGFTAHLTKPVGMKELQEMITKLLGA